MQTSYKIVKPVGGTTFAAQANDIYEKLKNLRISYAKVFLSDAQNQQAELATTPLFSKLSEAALTIVEQPPLDGCKISVLYKEYDQHDDAVKPMFHALRLSDEEAKAMDSYEQTRTLFERYLSIIEPLGLNIETHCVRTWIYVNDIDNNYAGVVKARNDVFDQHGMTSETHYIASTGIGGATDQRHACVAIDFLTYPCIAETDKQYLQALTHLNPTHEYGVAFERATKVADRIFISGTASINNKGQVLHIGDVEKQTDRLQENIAALLANGGMSLNDVQYFIVYLRDVADYKITEEYMQKHYPATPYIIVQGRVCRPTWLIEMECVATK